MNGFVSPILIGCVAVNLFALLSLGLGIYRAPQGAELDKGLQLYDAAVTDSRRQRRYRILRRLATRRQHGPLPSGRVASLMSP